MSWILENLDSKKKIIFSDNSILTIGTEKDADILIQKNRSSVHSQIILDEKFLFHIHNEKVKIFYKKSSLVINDETYACSYQCSDESEEPTHLLENREECFLSQDFIDLFENLQKTYFDFHQVNKEYKSIQPHELINHIAYLSETFLFDSLNVFTAKKRSHFKNLVWCLWARIFKYGILTPAILNDDISEIMVNGKENIYFEIKGKLQKSSLYFKNENELIGLIEKICAGVGRRIDESNPSCDARLSEGHRIHAIIPPLSLVGPCLTIRKFPNFSFTLKSLLENKSLTEESFHILTTAIKAKKNILISGGTGSGKTTLLNCLSRYIPHQERIITIEDSAELQLQQPHTIRLECRHENTEQKGSVTVRDLLKNSLRMRPDRIIIGECRGEEALDMLQAMNTGHNGSMTTLHANTPTDALRRLETLTMFGSVHLPSHAIREQICSAINIVVQQSRLPCGSRAVTAIEEVAYFHESTSQIKTKTLYEYNSTR